MERGPSMGREVLPIPERTNGYAAPEGAPNVVVVLIDDMGFGASSAFGGPCEMPTAERLSLRLAPQARRAR